jgi:predicted ribosomally synthesized peptide with nif11-like leader
MSEEQLTALLGKLKEDAGLKEKLQGAGTLDAAVEIAKEAGCDVYKADFIRLQANQMLALSDDEIEKLAKDSSLREKLGSAARDFTLANFGVKRLVRDHEEIYKSLIASQAKS